MKKLLFLLLVTSSITFATEHYKAFVCVPVADCIGEPLASHHPAKTAKQAYNELPISWGGEKNSMLNCPRIHQLLFNEEVTVIQKSGDEVLVKIPNMFYEKPILNGRYNQFWTHQSNVTAFHRVRSYPYHFLPSKDLEQNNVVTLKLPFYNAQTGHTYSAGTRFVYTDHKNGKAIETKKADGSFSRSIKTFKILKIQSAWK